MEMEKLLEPLKGGAGRRDVLRVLSDALLEREDPWGEAIQLALDLEERFPGEDETIDGERRLRRLTDMHGPSWCVRLFGERKSMRDYWPRFYRAIPSAIGLGDNEPLTKLKTELVASLALYAERGELNSPLMDQVTELTVAPGAGTAKTLELGRTKNVTHLSIPWLGAETVRALKRAPCLSQLESLTFTTAQPVAITAPELTSLFALAMPKLNTLAFERLEFGVPGAEALRDAMTWKVRRLFLDEAALGVKGTLAFLGAKWLPEVKLLSLARNAMGPAGAEALAAAPLKLVALDLSQTASAAKALVPFFENVKWPTLRSMALNGCALKGKAVAPLAAARLSGLRELRFNNGLIGDDGLAELAKSKTLTSLRVLQLANNSVKGAGVGALGKSAMMKTVEELDLSHNKFQNTGAKGLAASKNVGSLRVLTLGHNWMGVQGLRAMLGNSALKNFEELREGMNNYGAGFPLAFLEFEHLKLEYLRLGPDTTTKALEDLLKSPRVAKLRWLILTCQAFGDPQAELLLAGPLAKAKTQLLVSRAWGNQLTEAAAQKLKAALGARLEFV